MVSFLLFLFFVSPLFCNSVPFPLVDDVIIRDTFVISVSSGQKKESEEGGEEAKTSPDMTQLSGCPQTIEHKQTTPHGPATPADLPLKNGKFLRNSNGRDLEGKK